MERIEINVQTGERVVIALTEDEIAAAQSAAREEVVQPVDPLTKLRQFLAANPDVQALL